MPCASFVFPKTLILALLEEKGLSGVILIAPLMANAGCPRAIAPTIAGRGGYTGWLSKRENRSTNTLRTIIRRFIVPPFICKVWREAKTSS